MNVICIRTICHQWVRIIAICNWENYNPWTLNWSYLILFKFTDKCIVLVKVFLWIIYPHFMLYRGMFVTIGKQDGLFYLMMPYVTIRGRRWEKISEIMMTRQDSKIATLQVLEIKQPGQSILELVKLSYMWGSS